MNQPYIDQNIAAIPHRTEFINKVFAYFGLAVLLSALGVFWGPSVIPINNTSLLICGVAEIALIFTARMWTQRRPLNVLLFGLFAFLTGVTIVPLLAYANMHGGSAIIANAFVATFCMFTAAATYGYVTKRDLSSLGGILTMSLIGLIVVGILQIFWFSSIVHMITSGIGIVVFSLFTAYDIQRIKLTPNTLAIEAALMLYLDIFLLFQYILQFMLSLSQD